MFSGGRLGLPLILILMMMSLIFKTGATQTLQNQKIIGVHFKIRPVSGGGTAEENIKSTYGLSRYLQHSH